MAPTAGTSVDRSPGVLIVAAGLAKPPQVQWGGLTGRRGEVSSMVWVGYEGSSEEQLLAIQIVFRDNNIYIYDIYALVTSSDALVTSSDALVTTYFDPGRHDSGFTLDAPRGSPSEWVFWIN